MKNKAIKVSALLCTLMLIVVGLSILFGNQRNDEITSKKRFLITSRRARKLY